MLEKPDLPDRLIISQLQQAYELRVSQLSFLPVGADVNTAVYRVVTLEETEYFLKLRKGSFDDISVTVPLFLRAQGNHAIIAPLETAPGQAWTSLGDFKLILYPYVEGQDGYEVELSEGQWRVFGSALRGVHTAQVPPALGRLIPRESFSPKGRELVNLFQVQVGRESFDDPTAAKLAAFMQAKRGEISLLVERAEDLANALQVRSLELVLCHADIHAGNLLLGANEALYIVDWDNPTFSPKERDLALIRGSAIWNSEHIEALFYDGYGQAEIDPLALAYYRYERIIQDIAAFCQQLLLTRDGGKDREQSLMYLTSQFLPEHEVELAFASLQ